MVHKGSIWITDWYNSTKHDDVIKWKHFRRHWPFVRGIHRSPANSPHKGQWRGTLMFCLICTWINGWVYNREAGDLRRNGAHYDVTVMNAYHSTDSIKTYQPYQNYQNYAQNVVHAKCAVFPHTLNASHPIKLMNCISQDICNLTYLCFQFIVSMKRISAFLLREDIDTSQVTHDSSLCKFCIHTLHTYVSTTQLLCPCVKLFCKRVPLWVSGSYRERTMYAQTILSHMRSA